MTRFVRFGAFVVLFASIVSGRGEAPGAIVATNGVQSVSEQGVAVEFKSTPVTGAKASALQEGQDVVIQFKISDTATGASIRGAQPTAWVVRLADGERVSEEATLGRAQALLGGGFFTKPDADLNGYHVLVLNEDGTISVVDPLFGFGGSKLLAMVPLNSRGEDWVLSSNQRNLYVSMPDSDAVAVVDTTIWSVEATIPTGQQPTRVAIQPDQHYLWIANLGSGSEAADWGVTVVAADNRAIAAHIPTGKGPYEMVFTEDSHSALILNRGSGTLSVIDIAALKKIRNIPIGKRPVSLDYCAKSNSAFITDEESGQIVVVDARRGDVLARIQAEPGLGQIKFPPNGRFGFAVNPKANLLHIVDSASDRIVQTGDMQKEPYQIAFSDQLAYIRHRQTATVLMIPLDKIGMEGKPIPVLDFEGGRNPPAEGRYPSPAESIVQAPGVSAVLVANDKDEAVYYYEEGMAASKGEFSDYGHNPRAVLTVDRSLRERSEPGTYETVVRLGEPGLYEAVFVLSSPRIVKGFQLEVQPNPELERIRSTGKLVALASVENRVPKVEERVAIHFKITDKFDQSPKTDLENLTVLAYLAPGVWQMRIVPQEMVDGVYGITFEPPKPGVYYVNLLKDGEVVPMRDGQQLILEVVEK
jgi:YVTN family beta-propeller protein